MTLRAYHGDPELKESTLAKIAEHRAADQIIQGLYWGEGDDGVFRGCAVGCLLEDPDGGHERYEAEFGIPVQLAWLEDGIFEGLPAEMARLWPERFLGAIVPGADLSTVWPRFAVWLMTDPIYGLIEVTDKDDVKDVCWRVADAYSRVADGETITDEEAQLITDAARYEWAARNAWAARDEWDARAAWAVRAVRDAWAAWAVRDEWDARAAWVARDAFVQASADKLVELLAEAPVVAGTPT